MKKFLPILIVITLLAVIIVTFAGCSSRKVDFGTELIINGNLENGTTAWSLYTNTDKEIKPSIVDIKNGDSTTYLEESEKHGGAYISISASSNGDSYAYYSQPVGLEKNAKYLLKADVKVTSKIENNGIYGAFVGLAESGVIYRSITDAGDWQTLEVVFYNYSYDEVNVRFGIGTDTSDFYAGSAVFDNVSLQKVTDEDVLGLVTLNLGSKGVGGYDADYLTTPSGIVFTVLLTVLGAALIYAFYVWYRRYSSKVLPSIDEATEQQKNSVAVKGIVLSAVAVVVAFAIRLVLVLTLYGHGSLMNQISLACESINNNGLIKYYYEFTPYYTPGVTYLLALLGAFAKLFNLSAGTQGFALFVKIPSVIADLLIVFFLYNIANKKTQDPIKSFIIALSYALIPVAFIASSVFGSFMTVGVLFLLLAFVAVRDRKIIKLTVFYTLSVMFIAEALLLLPLLITYAVVLYVKYPDTRNVLPISATVAIVGGYALTIPLTWNFFVTGRPFIVLERYFTIFSEIDLFTDGAFNVYAMLGLQNTAPNTAGVVMSAIIAALGMLMGIGLYIKCRDRQKLILIASFTILFIYTFCVRMTVFVVLPAIVLAFLYVIYTGERRILAVTASTSILVTLSACYDLMVCKYVPGGINAQEIPFSSNDPVVIIFSVLLVIVTLITGVLVFDICVKDRERKVRIIDQNYCKYVLSLFKRKKDEQEESVDADQN